MSLVVSVDVGGTFTDLAAFDDGLLALHKRPTETGDPARGMLAGVGELLERISARAGDVARVVHATTLATNALIEGRGARTALVTTAGFADVLEIGAEQMHSIFALFARHPEPLVPAGLRREVAERVLADGRVLTPLDERGVAALVDELAADGVEAVAVCLLHAYRNAAHEQLVRRVLAERHPSIAVSLSSEVAPTIGEYERTSTTCIDAYLKPLLAAYAADVEAGLERLGVRGELQFVSSAGGILDARAAAHAPVRLLESGPAAGALGAAWFAANAGIRDVLALDLGGTTAKLCLVEDARPHVAPSFEADRVERLVPGSGRPVQTPSVDLIEIGAGGGSIARVDDLGLLKVGPRSAGSFPGPACYGRGGREPTLTDADLLVGALDGDDFLGGRMVLDRDAAEEAVRVHVAEPLGLAVLDAARGIRRVAEEAMTRAARTHLQERNRDPRGLALVAFGGAGPVHAVAIAEALGIDEVLIPHGAGVASSVGALTLDRIDVTTRTEIVALPDGDGDAVARVYVELADALVGAPAEGDVLTAGADVRFTGQFHELRVAVGWPPAPDELQAVEQRFLEAYARVYGRRPAGLGAEVRNWYLRRETPQRVLRRIPPAAPTAGGEARVGTREVDGDGPAWSVYARGRLGVAAELPGPAVVVDAETSVVVAAGWRARVDDQRNLVLARGPAS